MGAPMTGEGDRSLFEGGGGGLRGLSAGDTAGGVHGEDDAASLGDLRGLSAGDTAGGVDGEGDAASLGGEGGDAGVDNTLGGEDDTPGGEDDSLGGEDDAGGEEEGIKVFRQTLEDTNNEVISESSSLGSLGVAQRGTKKSGGGGIKDNFSRSLSS